MKKKKGIYIKEEVGFEPVVRKSIKEVEATNDKKKKQKNKRNGKDIS